MKMDRSCLHLWCARFPSLVRLWWCAYVLVMAFQYQIAGGHDSLLMAFFNGGLFLAALLHIGRRLDSIRWMAVFSILVFVSDWLLMVVLAEKPVTMSLAITATLVLQGWLGYFFLRVVNLQRELPDTQKKVIWFSWAAALFPVVVSSLVMTVLALYLAGTADAETFGVNFLWWSVSRFTSVVLVAPAVLFIVDRYEAGASVEWENEFLVFALGAVLFALVLFSIANPPRPGAGQLQLSAAAGIAGGICPLSTPSESVDPAFGGACQSYGRCDRRFLARALTSKQYRGGGFSLYQLWRCLAYGRSYQGADQCVGQ